MNECKIVQDLMPLYVEELVSTETGEFIREHLTNCEICSGFNRRMLAPMKLEEESTNYKKKLRRDILKIITQTVLAVSVLAAIFLYGLWEWGWLDREVYKSPDGSLYFEVIDVDSGFFEGGAYIVTPDGRGRNLYGDESYQDFNVWFAPDNSGYFVWIKFDDHDETYLMTSVYDEEGEYWTSSYFPSFEIKERDFLGILKAVVEDYLNLTDEDLTISFEYWSNNNSAIYFNYESASGYSGEICFNVKTHEWRNLYTRKPESGPPIQVDIDINDILAGE